MAAPVTIDYVSDWAARLRTDLYAQYQGKVTWAQWVTLLARQTQALENSAQSLLTILDIANSVGVQLDVIGRIVGQPRLGAVDATYRLYLYARILANNSDGTAEQLYTIMTTLFGSGMIYIPGIVKQFILQITTVLTATQAAVAVQFLKDAEEAGARGILQWQQAANASMLYTGATAMIAVAYTAGLPVITAYCLGAQFGPVNTVTNVIIDRFLPNAETGLVRVFSADVLVTQFATAFNHAVGATIEIVADLGLGLGDANDASVGGQLAGAA